MKFAPKVQAALNNAGLGDIEALRKIGAAGAFLLLKSQGLTVTNSVLWQLDAYERNVDWAEIDENRKNFLLQQIKEHPPTAIFPPEEIMAKMMDIALSEAQTAAEKDEVPVGAVIVKDNKIIARAHNSCMAENNIAAHAEIKVLAQAAQIIGSCRLDECDLYITLEPCPMCAGAILQARIKRVIYALPEPKSGAAGSVVNLFHNRKLNHHTAVLSDIGADKAKKLLQQFFHNKR